MHKLFGEKNVYRNEFVRNGTQGANGQGGARCNCDSKTCVEQMEYIKEQQHDQLQTNHLKISRRMLLHSHVKNTCGTRSGHARCFVEVVRDVAFGVSADIEDACHVIADRHGVALVDCLCLFVCVCVCVCVCVRG